MTNGSTNGTDPLLTKVLGDADEAQLLADAADLARHDVAQARTEVGRSVDAAKTLASVIGVMGTAALGAGSLLVGQRGIGSAGAICLLVSGGLLVVALERCISVIQANIGRPTPDAPGWYGACGLEMTGDAKADDAVLLNHYIARAKQRVVTFARETRVVGGIAGRKHLKNKPTARMTRLALLIGVVGVALAALHI